METLAGQYVAAGPPSATANTMVPVQVNAKGELIVVGDPASPIVVTISEPVGALAWAAPVVVGMTGSSKTFVPADATRKALIMWSAPGNTAGAFDTAGGTVTTAGNLPLFASTPVIYTGADTPVGIVTAIGTNTQNFIYQQAT